MVYWVTFGISACGKQRKRSRTELREKSNYSAGPVTELAKGGRSLGLEWHVGVILNGPMARSLHVATGQDVRYTEKSVTLGEAALCKWGDLWSIWVLKEVCLRHFQKLQHPDLPRTGLRIMHLCVQYEPISVCLLVSQDTHIHTCLESLQYHSFIVFKWNNHQQNSSMASELQKSMVWWLWPKLRMAYTYPHAQRCNSYFLFESNFHVRAKVLAMVNYTSSTD